MSESNNHSCGTGLSGTTHDHEVKEAALSPETYDVERLRENAIRLAKGLAMHYASDVGVVYKAICQQMRIEPGHVHFNVLTQHSFETNIPSPRQFEKELKEISDVRIRLFGDDYSSCHFRNDVLNHLNNLSNELMKDGKQTEEGLKLLSQRLDETIDELKEAVKVVVRSQSTIHMVKMALDNYSKNIKK
jgi:hypothetical protein